MEILSQLLGGIGLALLFLGGSLAIPGQEIITALCLLLAVNFLLIGGYIGMVNESKHE